MLLVVLGARYRFNVLTHQLKIHSDHVVCVNSARIYRTHDAHNVMDAERENGN